MRSRSWGIWNSDKNDWVRNQDGSAIAFSRRFNAAYHMRREIVGRKRDPESNRLRKAIRIEPIPRALSVNPSDDPAMNWLRSAHPEFFGSPTNQGLAAIITEELGEYLHRFKPVDRVSIIAGIIALQYRMGTAAIQSVRDPEARHMADILVANHQAEKSKKK